MKLSARGKADRQRPRYSISACRKTSSQATAQKEEEDQGDEEKTKEKEENGKPLKSPELVDDGGNVFDRRGEKGTRRWDFSKSSCRQNLGWLPI